MEATCPRGRNIGGEYVPAEYLDENGNPTPRNARSGQYEYAQKCGNCGQGNYSFAATKCGRCGRSDNMHRINWAAPDARFTRYYASGERIRVRLYGETMTGTVGRTTGWSPAYLLMLRSNSLGSPWILGSDTEIIAVKKGGRYVPLTTVVG